MGGPDKQLEGCQTFAQTWVVLKKDEATDIIKRDFTKLLHSAIIEILKNFPQSKKDDFFFQLRFPALATGVFYKESFLC